MEQVRNGSSPGDNTELSLREMLGVLWRGRVLVIAISAFCTLAAGTTAWLLPKKYVATVLMSPVSSPVGGSLGALGSAVSQLGGLASLAGLSVSGGNTAKVEAIATLKSENLTRRFIEDHNLLPLLFSKKWDARQLKWKTNDPERLPTLWKGNEFFAKNVRRVTEDTKTGLVTLTITWTEARLAAEWANDLVKMTNDFLRDKAIQESERNVAYLADQADKTKAVPVRDSIYNLMESEIKKEMVARGSQEYALKVIDPAVTAERHSSPQKSVWTITGFLIGLITSSAILLMRKRDPAG
jgi:uncharacterized protein involved in exopolysaccharide biosynthesis